jgi:hypothetical protein
MGRRPKSCPEEPAESQGAENKKPSRTQQYGPSLSGAETIGFLDRYLLLQVTSTWVSI